MSNDKMPVYTMQEVAKHASKQDCIWITYLDGVYDITNYVDRHPGGSVIMVSAGSSMDQEFMTYPFHKKEGILKQLKVLRIGTLRKEDVENNLKNVTDPYACDPQPSDDINVLIPKPLCGGPPIEKLTKNFITPANLFFVRNHLPVPMIDVDTHEIIVSGIGIQEKRYTLCDLQRQFSKYSVTMAMQCAGNRRNEMDKVKPVKGAMWDASAIHNAVWSGVLLYDLLRDCGFQETRKDLHVQFEGIDTDPMNVAYGASIPIAKIDPVYKVIVAYEVNNGSIPLHNGHPVRMIIPGVCGARSVKWLARIIVSDQESNSLYQQMDYKGFSPSVRWDTVDFDSSPAVQELPVTSMICNIKDGQDVSLKSGSIFVTGYAYSGGGRKIIRIDVTGDGGKRWKTATLTQDRETDSLIHCWTWTLWKVNVPISGKTKAEIWVKAVDSSYNVQPESFENIWNYGGVLCNAYCRIKVNIV